MIYFTNECVDCGLPCVFNSCKYFRVPHYECDEHEGEVDKLYKLGDYQVCEECLEEHEKRILYESYKEDWCKARGVQVKAIDEETGINGECYVCYEEFLDNEYQDEEYVEYLFENYNPRIERIEVK